MTRRTLGVVLGWIGIACGGSPGAAAPATEAPGTAVTPIASAPPSPVEPRRRVEPGTRELVKELGEHDALSDEGERWVARDKTFAKIRALADPRGADALYDYLGRAASFASEAERVHFRTLAALALAELGDLRALPALVERLAHDPLTLYGEGTLAELSLRRDDGERVACARVIADLAELHPEQQATIRAQAEKPVWAWVTSMPSPHANGLRALAKMKSDDPKIRATLRQWADPKRPLPAPGAQPPFPEEFVIARVALRYLGALQDDKAKAIGVKQLGRRPKTIDASMDALLQGGMAIVGMTLRALATGAAEGLSELGDAKAIPALMKLVDDPKENEQARMSACPAVVWLADEIAARDIASRIESARGGAHQATHFRASCWLTALAERPLPAVKTTLFGFVLTGPAEQRELAARALGHAGVDAEQEQKLVALLSDATMPERRAGAALALLLGGSEAAAKHVIGSSTQGSDFVRDLYARSVGFVTHEDLQSGRLLRWVTNALAAGDSWASRSLGRQLSEVVYDNGPHSLTRVVLRRRLLDLAKSGSAKERDSVRDALELMQARGSLLALDEFEHEVR